MANLSPPSDSAIGPLCARLDPWGSPGPATRPLLPHPEVHLRTGKGRIMAITDGASPVPGPVHSGPVQSTQSSRPHKVRATLSATLGEEQTTSQRERGHLPRGTQLVNGGGRIQAKGCPAPKPMVYISGSQSQHSCPLGHIIPGCEDCPMPCRVFSSTPALYPLDAKL